MAESSINMKFTASTADAQKRIADLEKEVSRLNDEAKKSQSASSGAAGGLKGMSGSAASASSSLLKTVGAITATVAAAKVLINVSKQLINEYVEAEKVSNRLNAVWANVGSTTGKSADEMNEYADALEKQTYFSAESIKEAGLLLAATQSLTDEGFDRALQASMDLAAALGEDVTSAAQTLARAVQDPEAALSRLKAIGVNFTEAEKQQIQQLIEANKNYEAQALILEKIEDRYGGVAQAINDTPSGKLDNIKDALSDIRKNLGGALLDVISPALDLVYKGLMKISEWVSKARSAVKTEQDVKVVTDRLNKGEGFEGIEDDVLMAAQAQYERDKGSSNLRRGLADTTYDNWIREIQEELDRRAEELAKQLSVDAVQANIIAPAEDAVTTELKTAAEFLKQYGSSSASYRAAGYQSIIDQAKALQQQMLIQDDTGTFFNKATREAWGVESIDEFRNLYIQLGEVIEDAQKNKDALFAEPKDTSWKPEDFAADYAENLDHLQKQIQVVNDQIAAATDPALIQYLETVREELNGQYEALTTLPEPVDELGEYLKENAHLSATAQAAMLDAQIAEAEMWRAAAAAGSQEATILDEIIAKLKEEREELEKTGDKTEETTTDIIAAWTQVSSSIGSVVSATTSYMTQMWDQQADELEKSLKAAKEAGDVSEAEEKDRLRQINELRKKSWEADKANSVAQAVINAAQSITSIWSQFGANPALAVTLSALSAAATGIQIATIESQRFTPMARGGIVTQATPIIAGEAGPEAIIPLSGGRGKQYLEGHGGVTINITIQGNADEEVVFHAIERAQRTGYLPNWQYT